MRLVLVADPSLDLSDLASRLREAGAEVSTNSGMDRTSILLCCVSCCDGPMADTISTLHARAGSSAAACGIVLTDAASVADAELIELVALETQELLGRVTETAEVDIPCLRDDQPDLMDAVRALPDAFPSGVSIQAPRDEPRKPWWKFW